VGTDGRKKTAWAAALFITSLLGMASREEFVLFPVMLSLYDLYFISRRNIKGLLKTYRIHLPVISTLGYVLFIVLSYDYGEHAGYGVKTITPLQYLITQFNVHWTYLRLLVLPINQNLDYDYPIAKTLIELPTMISFIGYIGIWVTGILLYRKKPIVSFCILWFMITLAPSSSIMPLADVIFEHRLYLPVIGLISGCVVSFFYLLDKIKKQRYTDGVTISSLVIFAVFIIFLSTVTYSRNMVWTNAIGLWADTALKSPAKARPYVTLAEEYRKAGDNDKALAYFQQAISIDPNFYEAYTGVGQILTHFHRYSEAIHSLEKAIQLNPRYAQAFNSLGIIYALTADYQGAIEQFHQALRIDPSDIRAAINLGNAYMERGNLSTSNYYYAYAMRLDSNNPDIYFNLGVLQERLGNYENAASYYRQALALNPGHTEAIRTLNIIRNQIAK
ncbi:MAG: tetratricopeptide repeat protein, partial [bacterium]